MKKRFLEFVGKSKLAFFITLIPIVNFIYPLMLCVFAPIEKLIKYIIIGSLLPVAINTIGKSFIPNNYPMIIPMALMFTLSILSLIPLRPMVLESEVFHRYVKIKALLAGFLYILLIIGSVVVYITCGTRG